MSTSRKPRRSPEQARAAREEKLAAAHQQIQDYVEQLTSGDDWRQWLDVAARFPRYSPTNQLLIAAQLPTASHVAGFNAWKDLGRWVRKGEKGLTIFAPVKAIIGWTKPDGTEVHADKPVRKHEVPAEAKPIRAVVAYKPVSVFDVSQTEGKPLPQRPIPDPVSLDGDAPAGMREGLETLVSENGFRLTHEPSLQGEDGYTDYINKTINLTPGQSDAHAALTLAHEVGHMLLHDPTNRSPDEPRHHRGIGEVEAESVAYLVAEHFGYDTRENSFPYITEWAGRNNPADVVRTTAQRVVTTAQHIIDRIDPAETHTDAQLLHRATLTREAATTINEPHTAEPQQRQHPSPQPSPAAQLARAAAPITVNHALATRTDTGAAANPHRIHTQNTTERER